MRAIPETAGRTNLDEKFFTKMRVTLTVGFATLIVLVGGIAGWAATAQISGAAISSGTLVVASTVKPVKHPTGGVVADVRVRNGERVRAGQVLVTLDDTVVRANLDMIEKQVDVLRIEAARLSAERDEARRITIPDGLACANSPAHVCAAIDAEARLFQSRRVAFDSLIDQSRERIAQLEDEADGISGQIAAKDREIALIADELAGLKPLEDKRLVTTNRMAALRREAARLDGERAQLSASLARVRGMATETDISILQRQEDRRTETVSALRDVQARLTELDDRAIAARDQLTRTSITSPQDGIVHKLAVHAPGAVISPRETILMIVPHHDDLVVEARVLPADIDRVGPGATAFVRFATFNQHTTPTVNATVQHISADLAGPDNDGAAFYLVRLSLSSEEVGRLGDIELRPGMPADVQIRTEARTALSFLVKPFADQVTRAFRER